MDVRRYHCNGMILIPSKPGRPFVAPVSSLIYKIYAVRPHYLFFRWYSILYASTGSDGI